MRLAPAKRSEGAETQRKLQQWGQFQIPGNGFDRPCNLKRINADRVVFLLLGAHRFRIAASGVFQSVAHFFQSCSLPAMRARPKDDLSGGGVPLWLIPNQLSSWAQRRTCFFLAAIPTWAIFNRLRTTPLHLLPPVALASRGFSLVCLARRRLCILL